MEHPVKSFSTPRKTVGDLDADAAAALISAAADIALILDDKGVIRDVAFSNEELAHEFAAHGSWLGQPWIETVARDSRPKVEELSRGEGAKGGRWRHVNQVSAEGASIPILYSTAPIGKAGRIVVFGRDLRPVSRLQQRLVEVQQSMERDYSRLRQAETRYRLLFQMSPDPVMVLDGTTQRVTEANPAAMRLFGKDQRRAVGRPVAEAFAGESRAVVQALLASVRAAGRGDDVRARLAEDGSEVTVSASTFRQEGALLFLLRISAPDSGAVALPPAKSKLLKLVEQVPDAFVVTGPDGRVITANAAFIEMIEAPGEDQVRGEPLDRWLGVQDVEAEVLFSHLRNRGSVRLYTSTLRGEHGLRTEVEISAVTVMNGGKACFGFAMRDVGARIRPAQGAGFRPTRSVEQLTELIGRVPLKDLVREATDAIERLCIEAALELSGDNRASAAEMLGLSRQSLYVKLRRYGLGDLGAEPGEAG
ncbi:transcriptional regulator PpsR [Neoroseomonas rubea]|uniref:transcriptional regulator PpsR n=1 Tax=Neoroseomonas rubea TaxID=2748666 RepID=UPI002FCCDC0A